MDPNFSIYVVCPDIFGVGGGIKQLYRHVEVLNELGYKAFILHAEKGFEAAYFEHKAPIAYAPEEFKKILMPAERSWLRTLARRLKQWDRFLKSRSFRKHVLGMRKRKANAQIANITANDYLVIPEVYGSAITSIGKGIKKVIMNQNCHFTFDQYPITSRKLDYCYEHPDVLATMVVSEHSKTYLSGLFEDHLFYRIINGINPKMFNLAFPKKKKIAYMTRKLRRDVAQVINGLKLRGRLGDFELVKIEKQPEKEVAKILKESMFFLSFCDVEGWPLPPAEAMACGCVVIGYDGFGAKEYFDPEFCYPVEARNALAFMDKVEEVVQEFERDGAFVQEKGHKASRFILENFSLEKEKNEINRFWGEVSLCKGRSLGKLEDGNKKQLTPS